MKKAATAFFILSACAAGLCAQSHPTLDAMLQPLSTDIAALVGSIDSDIAPQLLPAALAGDIVGEAAFAGDFPHGTVILPSIGVTFGNGLATVLNDTSHNWQFTMKMPDLVQNALGGSGSDLYSASRQIFPYPTIQGGVGFGVTKGIEILANGLFIPQALTNTLVSAAGSSKVNSLSPQFSAATIELRVRKVLFYDSSSYPAMSLSLGGVYGDTKLGASVNLASLQNNSGIDLGGIGTLNLTTNTPILFDAQVFGMGLDFAISKRFPVITPFASTGLWYRHAVVSTTGDLTATITPATGAPATEDIAISSTKTDDAIAGRIGAGFELHFWAFVLHFGANLDLENPLVDIQKFSLTGIAANGLSINTGIRWAF